MIVICIIIIIRAFPKISSYPRRFQRAARQERIPSTFGRHRFVPEAGRRSYIRVGGGAMIVAPPVDFVSIYLIVFRRLCVAHLCSACYFLFSFVILHIMTR